MSKQGITAVIRAMKEGMSIVMFPPNWKSFERGLASHISRGYIPRVQYKRVRVVADDTLIIGVKITRTSGAALKAAAEGGRKE